MTERKNKYFSEDPKLSVFCSHPFQAESRVSIFFSSVHVVGEFMVGM